MVTASPLLNIYVTRGVPIVTKASFQIFMLETGIQHLLIDLNQSELFFMQIQLIETCSVWLKVHRARD